jgi:hypothetical protein
MVSFCYFYRPFFEFKFFLLTRILSHNSFDLIRCDLRLRDGRHHSRRRYHYWFFVWAKQRKIFSTKIIFLKNDFNKNIFQQKIFYVETTGAKSNVFERFEVFVTQLILWFKSHLHNQTTIAPLSTLAE